MLGFMRCPFSVVVGHKIRGSISSRTLFPMDTLSDLARHVLVISNKYNRTNYCKTRQLNAIVSYVFVELRVDDKSTIFDVQHSSWSVVAI